MSIKISTTTKSVIRLDTTTKTQLSVDWCCICSIEAGKIDTFTAVHNYLYLIDATGQALELYDCWTGFEDVQAELSSKLPKFNNSLLETIGDLHVEIRSGKSIGCVIWERDGSS